MTSTQIISKEGYKGIFIIAIFAIIFLWLGWSLFIFLSFLCLILWIFAFRNPERLPEDKFNPILTAPIDGKIIEVFNKEGFICIVIDVDWLDVGILRAPIDVLEYDICKRNGLFLRFGEDELKNHLNTQIFFSSKEKYSFKIELYPEIFSSTTFYNKSAFSINDRIGFMKLGKLKLFFPAKFLDLKVNVGDKIKGGQTLIGYIK
ncbi:phosphatidylserine decarboxylase [Helicobacter cappadocius]|uniref:Phosphatidylserine decarboxylase n=1 Tax=Helicobacter cappadocius TaxID=3063998 RepID=A0AA90T8V6_9HELI|nr:MULTISPECIES: phosphatidylserine decarboxylase [unclassified Helicobacter]MDO7252325.1 hypothetical protein [Helicobacter sp. faydin-H75]MDP2538192.1 hypothetical protein [Helicobacter sp. faydin-H76]